MNGQIATKFKITNEMWNGVNDFNKEMLDEYLTDRVELSEQSRSVYKGDLKMFFWWVSEYCENKRVVDIKKREFVKYLNWLTGRGLSEATIQLKKSAVSALCNYILIIYEDEFPTFRPFVTPDMKVVKTGSVWDKNPLTPEELDHLCDVLRHNEEFEKLAYVLLTYSTGCRREETHQFRKEMAYQDPIIKEITYIDDVGGRHRSEAKIYFTNKVRCKGPSVVGKVRRLRFGEEAMEALRLWMDQRGEDDCPYVFTTTRGNETHRVCAAMFNYWCTNDFAKIVGRRVHPHLLRESRATNLVVHEHKSSKVAQKLLGHADLSTTERHYIIKDDDEDEMDAAFI